LHAELAEPAVAAGVDIVYCAGPLMRALWEALPSRLRGGYAETAAALEPVVLEELRAGDAIMIKGSLGSKMGPIVKALQRHYPLQAAPSDAAKV
jgi:UDP-N-acetylmuramoyl-tripeptide--D-alanyl-D-alanine ligase